jgi:hypothetical protein
MLRADDEAALDKRGDDGNTLGLHKNGLWDVVVSGMGQLVEVFGCLVEALGYVDLILIARRGNPLRGGFVFVLRILILGERGQSRDE